MSITLYVCNDCGARVDSSLAQQNGWLVASMPDAENGEMLIRCPDHRVAVEDNDMWQTYKQIKDRQ